MLPEPVAAIVDFMRSYTEAGEGLSVTLFALHGCLRCGDTVFYPEWEDVPVPPQAMCRRCGRVNLVKINPPYRYGWE